MAASRLSPGTAQPQNRRCRLVNKHSRKGIRGNEFMRKSLLLICVLGLSCVSWAQTNRASWSNLSGLQAGQKIQIVDMNSKKHSGAFVSVSGTALSYQDSPGEQTIQKQDVRSVKLMKNK